MRNAFVSGGTTVQFAAAPGRKGTSQAVKLFQPSGYDSAGDQYVYDKGTITRTTTRLSFPNLTTSLHDELRSFAATTARGGKNTFTWYDAAEASHTVRLVGPINDRQTGPNRWEAELTIQEDVPLTPPAAPASFAAARAAKSGVAPVWILKLTVNGTVYHLSASAFTIAGWGEEEITVLPWIARFGRIRESVTGDLKEIRMADFDLDLLADPAAAPNMVTLAEGYEIEESPAELYLWYLGLAAATDPPEMKFRGHARDVNIPNDTGVSLVLEDEAVRLQSYVGTRVSLDDYPNADPDDVGKVIPIVYGSPGEYPALAVEAGIITTLPATINTDDTEFPLSDATGLSVGDVLLIDAELLHITALDGDTVTVTRGYDGSTAADHLKGAQVGQSRNSFVYLAANHALDAISKVFAKVGGRKIDVTGIVTRYLGTVGDHHPDYPGRAAIELASFITVEQAVRLTADNGDLDLLDMLEILQGAHDHPQVVNGTLDILPDSHTTALAAWVGTISDVYDGNSSSYIHGSSFTAESFANFRRTAAFTTYNTPLRVRAKILYTAGTPTAIRAMITHGSVDSGYAYLPQGASVYGYTGWLNCSGNWGDINSPSYTNISVRATNDANLIDVWFEVDYGTPSLAAAPASGVGKNGGYQLTGNIGFAGNSVANTLIGDGITVLATRNITDPPDVFDDFLQTHAGDATLAVTGTFPECYKFDLVINEYRRMIDWLDSLAFQCRAYFRRICAVSMLIVRPDELTSVRTISTVRIDGDRRVYRREKAPLENVLNKIQVLYDRDWTMDKSDKSYRAQVAASDATSIARYGTRERPSLFQFDAVRVPEMAADLLAFWLATCKDRPWWHFVGTYLEQSDLRFAQAVTLGFAGNIIGEIREVQQAPGDTQNIDKVDLVVEI
jgi:hypothetical protein